MERICITGGNTMRKQHKIWTISCVQNSTGKLLVQSVAMTYEEADQFIKDSKTSGANPKYFHNYKIIGYTLQTRDRLETEEEIR